MCALAAAEIPRVRVSDFEARAAGYSYSYITMEHFCKECGGVPPLFVTGADSLLSLHTWKNPGALARACEFLVVNRAGFPENETRAAAERLRVLYGARVLFSGVTAPDVSSAEVRLLNSFGADLSPLLPASVAEYIRAHGLYTDYARYAAALRPLMSAKRYAHTLSVAAVACRLAKRWGGDVARAARAALLHDCAKEMSENTAANVYGLQIGGDITALHPKVRHGRIGALYAEKFLGESDPGVLSAVKYHTTGKADMTLLEKIIFVADYIDPLRAYPDSPALYALAFTDLDAAADSKRREIECVQTAGTGYGKTLYHKGETRV
jgi:nicotinate-nucleotide adenylyltransferase